MMHSKPLLAIVNVLITSALLLGWCTKSSAQNTLIPDTAFEQALIDLGHDSGPLNGSVPTANISGLTQLNVASKGISDLTGIEDFVSLEVLICYSNTITSLDLSSLTSLTELNCFQNSIGSLDFSQNSALQELNCFSNPIDSLDFSTCPGMLSINANYNNLAYIDVSQCPQLLILWLEGNFALGALDLSNNPALWQLKCGATGLSSLNLSGNPNLASLECQLTSIAGLNLSLNPQLTSVICHNNSGLVYLSIKNGNNSAISVANWNSASCPNLTCIEVDDVAYANANWLIKDMASTYSTSCSCPLPVVAVSSTNPSCTPGSDGTAAVSATGASPPYTWQWSSGQSSNMLSNLNAGTYTVSVSDAIGCMDTASVTLTTLCDQVSGLSLFNVQDSSVHLLWDTVCGASSYKIRWKQAGPGPWNTLFKHTQGGALLLSGLAPSTTYRFMVQANCASTSGWGPTSAMQQFTTLANACLQPTSLSANPVGSTQAKLVWQQQPTVIKYRIRWRATGSGVWNTIVKDGSWGHHWLTGLTPGTSYEWQMKSVCQYGQASGTFWTALTTFSTSTNKAPVHNPSNTPDGMPIQCSVYPNPAQSMVHIAYQGSDTKALASIVDLSGHVVATHLLVPEQRTEIPLNLAPGMYIISIESDWGRERHPLVVF